MSTFLPSAGGYRKLRAFILSEIICDLTMIFAKKFIRHGSRTRDQMEQAARSGKQNIAEGSEASRTSKETEIKLTNVAKASLEELLLDYEDYIRQNGLRQWDKNHPRTHRLREYLKSDAFMQSPTQFADRLNAEEYSNLCITLINQATYLLKRLIDRQQQQFLEQGGIKEQMYRARVTYRSRNSQGAPTSPTSPTGPTGPTSPTNHPNSKKQDK
ncbi:MAG: four helix bundle suffix domain-containing protein [Muribaculaceae bacterium]|nr:four helix bundle suffix domain-containing protein [Muribaculaceae bacterium]